MAIAVAFGSRVRTAREYGSGLGWLNPVAFCVCGVTAACGSTDNFNFICPLNVLRSRTCLVKLDIKEPSLARLRALEVIEGNINKFNLIAVKILSICFRPNMGKVQYDPFEHVNFSCWIFDDEFKDYNLINYGAKR